MSRRSKEERIQEAVIKLRKLGLKKGELRSKRLEISIEESGAPWVRFVPSSFHLPRLLPLYLFLILFVTLITIYFAMRQSATPQPVIKTPKQSKSISRIESKPQPQSSKEPSPAPPTEAIPVPLSSQAPGILPETPSNPTAKPVLSFIRVIPSRTKNVKNLYEIDASGLERFIKEIELQWQFYSEAGKYSVYQLNDNIHLLERESGRELLRVSGKSPALSYDGNLLIYASQSNDIKLHLIGTKEQNELVEIELRGSDYSDVQDLGLMHDGSMVVMRAFKTSGYYSIFSIALYGKGLDVREISGEASNINNMWVSRDGFYVIYECNGRLKKMRYDLSSKSFSNAMDFFDEKDIY